MPRRCHARDHLYVTRDTQVFVPYEHPPVCKSSQGDLVHHAHPPPHRLSRSMSSSSCAKPFSEEQRRRMSLFKLSLSLLSLGCRQQLITNFSREPISEFLTFWFLSALQTDWRSLARFGARSRSDGLTRVSHMPTRPARASASASCIRSPD